LGGSLTLDDPSHVLWLIEVAEEVIVLPIVEEEIQLISSFRLLLWAPGGPSNGGLIARALP
jgi:hypothetical protein